MVLVAFKAIDSVLRGQNGGFDSHTLPPYLLMRRMLQKNEAAKGRDKRSLARFWRRFKWGTDGNWVSDSQCARGPTGLANFSAQSIFPEPRYRPVAIVCRVA